MAARVALRFFGHSPACVPALRGPSCATHSMGGVKKQALKKAAAATSAKSRPATTRACRQADGNVALAVQHAKKKILQWLEDHPDQILNLWAQLEVGLVT